MSFKFDHLSCGYHGKAVIEDICFELNAGEVVCILGPNGIGKTTFFKTAQGFLPPIVGKVCINGIDIARMARKDIAKQIAYVPQTKGQPFDYTVFDMILMGRASFVGNFSAPSDKDRDICIRIMEDMGMTHLQNKLFTEISGGEQQLVLIGRALVQQPKFLMMDEPTSNLDFSNQVVLLKKVNALAKMGIGILMITHSPDHALICADRVALFSKDKRVLIGSPKEVISAETLLTAYGVHVRLVSLKDDAYEINTCVPII